jgi:hypothetical protein
MPNRQDKDLRFDANTSPSDWYVAGVLLRIEVGEIDEGNENRRCDAWENHVLIKASSPKEAFKRAVDEGKSEEAEYLNEAQEKVRFTFEGLTTLVPIYDELEDGSEILWTEYENKAAKTIRRWAKKKEDLEVFQKD